MSKARLERFEETMVRPAYAALTDSARAAVELETLAGPPRDRPADREGEIERRIYASAGMHRIERLTAYAALLEAAACVCLGVDVGYFDESPGLDLLERLGGNLVAGEVGVEDDALTAANEWFEYLSLGRFEEALGVRAFRDLELADGVLDPHFQSALGLLESWRRAPVVGFLAVVRGVDSAEWGQLGERDRAALELCRMEEERRAAAVGEAPSRTRGLLADGLIGTLRQIGELAAWAEATRGWAARAGLAGPAAGETELAMLEAAVGKIVGWRLDPEDPRARRRLEGVVESTEAMVAALLPEGAEHPWPEGLARALRTALADWGERTREVRRLELAGA